MTAFRGGINACKKYEYAKKLSVDRPSPGGWVVKHIPCDNLRCSDDHHKKNQKAGRLAGFLSKNIN